MPIALSFVVGVPMGRISTWKVVGFAGQNRITLQLNASVGVQEVHLNAVGGKMKRNVVRRKLNEVGGSAGDEGGGEVGLSDIRLEA